MGTIALCAIMRDEGVDVVEWVAFHQSLGFDPIVIYDHGSSGDSAAILAGLARIGVIKHIPWAPPTDVSPQISAYNHFHQNSDAEWICFLDADEFFNLKREDTVEAFLASFEEDVSAIALNWRVFGSSGRLKRPNDMIIESYKQASPRDHSLNHHVKTIFRARAATACGIHVVALESGRYVDSEGVDVDPGNGILSYVKSDRVQINHYILKSRQDFWKKQRRGNANRHEADPKKYTHRDEAYFTQHDRNEERDTSMRRFLHHTRARTLHLIALISQGEPGGRGD